MAELARVLEQAQEPVNPILGIFTQLRIPTKEERYKHPVGADEVWLDVELPLRGDYFLPKGQIIVLGMDGLEALTEAARPEELIQYWERFSRIPPNKYGNFLFSIWDGVISRRVEDKL